MPGLERAVDEAGDVQFRPFSSFVLVVLLLVSDFAFVYLQGCLLRRVSVFSALGVWLLPFLSSLISLLYLSSALPLRCYRG